jgi:hypothetical protein
MRTTYTIAAIAMFAVILGMSAIAPAMASKPNADVDHRIIFCHYQEEKTTDRFGMELEIPVPEAYLVIETDNKGKMNGHFKGQSQVAHHFPVDDSDMQNGPGDFVITNDDEENNPTDENDSVADCIALDAALGD